MEAHDLRGFTELRYKCEKEGSYCDYAVRRRHYPSYESTLVEQIREGSEDIPVACEFDRY